MSKLKTKNIDFLVIGSGIAGLNSALLLADYGTVLIITKNKLSDSSTDLAQGGIAAVVKAGDSPQKHIEDTMKAGSYHNNREAVEFLVAHAKDAINRLETLGVVFDRENNEYATSYEAAHSYPRVLHASDFTGHEIENVLLKHIRTNPNITVWEDSSCVELMVRENVCAGAHVFHDTKIESVLSRAIVLATGGAGQLYQWTTNPTGATGDGIALAYQAGAKLSDLEFIQFHPTALKENYSPLFLLSEALRGEGGVIVDEKGSEFVDPLLPRDQVARAIFHQQKTGEAFIDMRHKGKTFLQKRFPNIYKTLKHKGFDLSTDLIPITPAAHFMCGGVTTDLYGRTNIANLFAYGEVAATGVHGANRLASNSLLEGMVFSSQITNCIQTVPKTFARGPLANMQYYAPNENGRNSKKIQEIMWNYVGIERTGEGLETVITQLQSMKENSMVLTARLITQAALKRTKSLGTHYITNDQLLISNEKH